MKNEILWANCQNVLPEYIAMWEKLVNVDAGSRCGKGINKLVRILEDEFIKLGADIKHICVPNPEEGMHLLVTFKGSGKGKILAMAHLDTVFPEGTVAERPFKIEGDWAKGPGVADCKSGVNLLLFVMKQLEKLDYKDYSEITFLFNCDEEIASPYSRKILQQIAPQYDCAICCESGQVGDGVVISRKGSNEIIVKVYGKNAHAGSNPSGGANAIMEMIEQIKNIKALENVIQGTTINFTIINGGTKKNVIPDYVEAHADMRVTDPYEMKRVERAIAQLSQNVTIPGTVVEVNIIVGNPPFTENKATGKLAMLAKNIYKELDKELILVRAGGASDANWVASVGVPVIDGFGAVKGGKNHTAEESAMVSSVVPRMYLLSRMFMELGKKNA